MAEIVVSAIFTVLFEKLASESLRKLARSKGINSNLKKLKRSLIQINALLNDASQKEISDEAVKEWLNGLQHLAYDIDDVLDGLGTEVIKHKLGKESGAITSKVRKLIPAFLLSTRMHRKLDDIGTKLQELVEANKNLGLSVITNEKARIIRYEASLVDTSGIVGREGHKKALLQKLLGGKDESSNQNFSIVPIVGMGGVGKTTLARLLYDEKEVKDHFELKAWVCVSNEFNISTISKVIYQSVTGEKKEFEDLNLLQEALREKLNNKLFLIVLDDVWSESYGDWDSLVGPFLVGDPGSKIIMTTRKEQLLRKLGYAGQDPLEGLSPNDALSLFAQHALGVNNFDSHPSLRPYGEGFVKKCDGLPLALRALGRLLRTKTDDEEWKELLDSEIWRLGNRDEIIPALRLSYHDLSASLKQVFAYCCLFPKHYLFDKEELILLWMAEGFLHQPTTKKSMERLGLEYFEDLMSRSFFQRSPDDSSLFLMHDLISDLAKFVAGDFFSRLDIEMRRELRMEALGKCRHRSFVCEKYMVYERFNTFRGAKDLRTVLALSAEGDRSLQTFYLSNKVLVDLLHQLPLVRVLSLSNLNISEVPKFIGTLKHLRYLNLSQTKITQLPDNVCNLYNLQSLIIFGCHSLQELPKSFLKLRNLRHFDMRDTPLLKKMPLGIGELKSLRTLSKIIIEGDNGFSITVLKDLKDLQGSISIKGLEKVQSPMHAQEANLSHRGLSELEVEWSDMFDGSRKETLEKEVLNVLKPRSGNLKKFGIVSYGGIEFPNWVGDPSFIRLSHMSIHGCKKCISLPSLGQLPSLKRLSIQGMDGVTVVGLEFLGTNGPAFPSLETLSFEDMKGWEVWSTNSGEAIAAFPRLQELRLDDCRNLVKVSLEALPSLRVLHISTCGHDVLSCMVNAASLITMLNIHDISGLDDQIWGGVTEYLGAVEEVSIKWCDDIRYLWESEAEAGKVLVNLRMLDVRHCENLVSLGEKKEDHCGSNLPSLKSLVVQGCNKLKWCSCPNSIETLEFYECKSITSPSFPAGEQNLKVLTIHGSKELLEKELGQGEKNSVLVNSRMRMLESVDIFLWQSQTPIIELNCFIHLTKLVIKECPSMESFPDQELSNLTSLTHLEIVKCTSMDASFPRGLWPPKLIWLRIGGLKKPISEWGPQNFPTSLVSLHLTGGRSEDTSISSQLSHLLPSSLIYLGIEEFEKLESISVGLEHLISLQHLSINKCPKTVNLPEMLLSALLSLKISECPILKERSSRRGYYWPLTTHIPRINIS